jgi:uncharacterized membrane protein HdeD (DUF308 family)
MTDKYPLKERRRKIMMHVAQQTRRSYRNLVLVRGILALLFGVAVHVVLKEQSHALKNLPV